MNEVVVIIAIAMAMFSYILTCLTVRKILKKLDNRREAKDKVYQMVTMLADELGSAKTDMKTFTVEKNESTEEEKSLKCRMNLGARTDLYDALNWLDEIPSSLPRTEAERSIRAAIATLEELNDDQT